MLPIETIFLETIKDLEDKVNNPDEYKVIKASALLRSLLLDGADSLVHQVNRGKGKVTLRFRIIGV